MKGNVEIVDEIKLGAKKKHGRIILGPIILKSGEMGAVFDHVWRRSLETI